MIQANLLKRVLEAIGYLVAVLVLAAGLVSFGYFSGQQHAQRACSEARLAQAEETLEMLQSLNQAVSEVERNMLRQAEAQKRRQMSLQKEFSDYAHRTADLECLDADGLRLWRDAITGNSSAPNRGDGALPGAGGAPERAAPGAAGKPSGEHGEAPRLPPAPGRPAAIRVLADPDAAALPQPALIPARRAPPGAAHG
jgi:hypothetical protein